MARTVVGEDAGCVVRVDSVERDSACNDDDFLI